MFPTFYISGEQVEEGPYLANPSAATLDTTGWTITSGTPAYCPDTRGALGVLSARCFWGGTAALSSMYQRIDVLDFPITIPVPSIDAGTLNIRVSWWGGTYIQGPPTDQPEVQVVFLDSGLATISTSTNGPQTIVGGPYATTYRWDEFVDEFSIPVNTRYIDIVLNFHRNLGTNNDARIDDIRLAFFT